MNGNGNRTTTDDEADEKAAAAPTEAAKISTVVEVEEVHSTSLFQSQGFVRPFSHIRNDKSTKKSHPTDSSTKRPLDTSSNGAKVDPKRQTVENGARLPNHSLLLGGRKVPPASSGTPQHIRRAAPIPHSVSSSKNSKHDDDDDVPLKHSRKRKPPPSSSSKPPPASGRHAPSTTTKSSKLESLSSPLPAAPPMVGTFTGFSHQLFQTTTKESDPPAGKGESSEQRMKQPTNATAVWQTETQQESRPVRPDLTFYKDDILSKVEMEVLWLGEESIICQLDDEVTSYASRNKYNFEFIWKYATDTLKIELRKLRDDESSTKENLKQIIRLDDLVIGKRVEIVTGMIKEFLGRGFRRPMMKRVIAELRLWQRNAGRKEFPELVRRKSSGR